MNYLRIIVLILSIGMIGLASCTPESECGKCEIVTYDNITDTVISRQSAIEYCGSDLDEKENSQPTIRGNERTEWKCY